MNKALVTFSLLLVLFCNSTKSKETTPISMLLFDVPGLVWLEDGELKGQAYEALDVFLKSMDFDPVYTFQPSGRALITAEKTENSCIFPAEEYLRENSTLDFVLFVAAVPAILFSQTEHKKTLEGLKGTFAASSRGYLYHQVLTDMRINKVLVNDLNTAIKMLQAGRAEYILLSESMGMSLKNSGKAHLHPIVQVSEGRSWIACHKVNPLPEKKELLVKFKAFIESGKLEETFIKYNMQALMNYQYHPEQGRWYQAIEAIGLD